MLTKFISIKNVGRFRNSAGSPNPQLARHTFIAGANGFGKTTICSVLRSLHTGDGDHIIGRKALGSKEEISIELLYDHGPVRFGKKGWSEAKAAFAIFDGVFVGDNVHAGEIVDVAQKRNLYRIIVGEEGVKLAREDADLSAASRAATSEITNSAKGLQPFFAPGMKLENFLALEAVPDIDAKIDAQRAHLDAIEQADTLRKKPGLTEFRLPNYPEGLNELLATTLDHIADDAEALIDRHLVAHRMSDGGGNWISTGLGFAEDNCPFCGQSIDGLPLIAAFKSVFSARYKGLREQITNFSNRVNSELGQTALAELERVADRNSGAIEFWGKYVTFDWSEVALPSTFGTGATDLRTRSLAALMLKDGAPLNEFKLDGSYTDALKAYDEAYAEVVAVNEKIRQANLNIEAKRAAVDASGLAEAQNELAILEATRARHRPAIIELCDAHRELILEKDQIDTRRTEVRSQLNEHTEAVLKPYQNRINGLLDRFNAGFTVAETSHAYPGGIASSSYQLVINDTPVDIGNAKTPLDQPSFKNTLSAGDRTTLALAFFFAHLEADPTLASKIVVFDDPFTSQDNFRRGQTAHAIMRLASRCRQLIVLSHDATFLKQLWSKAAPSERVSLVIADHRGLGSKLQEIDLEKACQGRTASDIDDLQLFLSTGAGGLIDLVRKMRVVLETYLRTTYPNSFQESEWLGDMVGKIRTAGSSHPAAALYDELDQINDYSAKYHHGENIKDITPEQIDGTELSGYVRRTLKIVNALQA